MKKIIPILLMALMMGCQHDKAEDTPPATTEPESTANPQDTDKTDPALAVNKPPIPVTGGNKKVKTGLKVWLDGESSYDLDGTVDKGVWEFVSRPDGSRAGFEIFNKGIVVSFVPDVDGIYTAKLTVTDNFGDSASATVEIEASTPIVDLTLSVPSEYATIQAAINEWVPGKIVEVAEGVYREQLTVDPGVKIVGAGPGKTVIRGYGTGDGVKLYELRGATEPVVIQGVTIEQGVNGVRVYNGIVELQDTVIRDNSDYGVSASDSNVTLTNVLVMDNSDTGIWLVDTRATIESVSVVNNSGGGIYGGSPLDMKHSIIAYNSGNGVNSDNFKIAYSTVHGNSDDGVYAYKSKGEIVKTIITGHKESSLAHGLYDSTSEVTQNEVLFFNNYCNWSEDYVCFIGSLYYDTVNALRVDPLYIGTNDLRLQDGSPAVDAGGNQIGAFGDGGSPPLWN